jgi:release factor glutamine methyltransferase
MAALANHRPSPIGGGAGGEGEAHKPLLVFDLIQEATALLAAALGLERREARLEAQILAARALGVNRAWLVAHDRDALTAPQAAAVQALIARRQAGEPVAYILGEKEFYGRSFRVTPDVLIPRPETELLVEAALERLPAHRPARVLDLGTGSGCIAITLASARPAWDITASDKSPASLEVARDNAVRLNVGNVRFVHGDWYDGLDSHPFDMIVSNPPYVAAADKHLGLGDLRHEPLHALVAGPLGLDAIRIIVSGAPAHLNPGGWLLLEHGHDQAPACAALMAGAGLEQRFMRRDLGQQARVSGGRKPASP